MVEGNSAVESAPSLFFKPPSMDELDEIHGLEVCMQRACQLAELTLLPPPPPPPHTAALPASHCRQPAIPLTKPPPGSAWHTGSSTVGGHLLLSSAAERRRAPCCPPTRGPPPPPRMPAADGQFLAAVEPSPDGALRVVGFCCGTLSTSDKLTEESMGRHEAEGGLLAIHSVCVAASHRRQGVATRLLKAYLFYVAGTTPQLREVRLICKEHLIPLYSGAGFRMVGPSDVVHGKGERPLGCLL